MDDHGQWYSYRLIVKPDNTTKVEVNQNELYSGDVKDDWELLKAEIMSDPDAWVDTFGEMICWASKIEHAR